MRRLGIAVVIGIVASVATAAGASAADRSGQGPIVMPCVGPRTEAIGFRQHPRHCLEYRDNESFSLNQILMNKIRWRHWGSARVKAHANLHYCAMGGCVNRPAKVAVFALRSRCGHRTYTRMRVKFGPSKGLPGEVYHLALPVCRTSL